MRRTPRGLYIVGELPRRDPARSSRVKDEFLAEDQLHGNDAGDQALAEPIDLSLFR
ncbi:hypothetical protein WMF20_00915 [Sorangium sp. So ce834]|uniref:hypothetical protein n=1 Tax=Sorangium sp. So ce834 TaxID=3133321 RepID=UPI003F5DE538